MPTPSTVTSTVSPGCSGPTPCRRSGRDQVPGLQGHYLRNKSHEHVERKEEVDGGAILPQLAVNAGFHADAFPRIEALGDDWPNRAEGVETFGAGPLPVLLLQVAGGHVVHAGVAEDIGPHVVALPQAVTALANHDAQLAFVIHPLAKAWLGRRISSPGPITEEGGFRKNKGSVGMGWFSSFACSR